MTMFDSTVSVVRRAHTGPMGQKPIRELEQFDSTTLDKSESWIGVLSKMVDAKKFVQSPPHKGFGPIRAWDLVDFIGTLLWLP